MTTTTIPSFHLHIPHHQPPSTTTPTTLTLTTTNHNLLHQKIIYLESLSINSLKALTLNPHLHTTPLSTLHTIESTLLTTFHLPRSSLGRIFDMFPSLLTSPPSSTLLPLHRFLLRHALLPPPLLPRSILRCPRLLVSSIPLQLLPSLTFLRHRLHLSISSPLTSSLLVSDVQLTLLPKVHFLKSLGFPRHDVILMVQRSPALLTYSIENNLVPKIEFYLEEMRGDLGEIRRFPQYFSFSLDGRIRPRFRLLQECGVSMSLKDMLRLSDGEFNLRLLELSSQVRVLL